MHGFYTERQPDDGYKIPGIQDEGRAKEEPRKEDGVQGDAPAAALEQEKKRKRKKRKKKKQTKEEEGQQPEQKQTARALKDDLAEHELFADSDQSEDEGIPDYKIGGYHPVHIGETMIDRYVVVQKLGWGHFSTVWLARDTMYNTYVALKVQKSASHYQEAAYDEVEILDVVAAKAHEPEWVKHVDSVKANERDYAEKGGYSMEDCHTVQLLNSFLHSGPNGQHFVMVFEILGVNLLEIMKRYDYKGIPMPLVRRMTKQVLIGLDYLHRMCRIIHTDLKPENVIVSLTKAELQEIQRRGQISTMNKTVKTQDVTKDGTLFAGSGQPKKSTLLADIDTTGMSKQQKKKLRKKMKKALEADGTGSPTEEAVTGSFVAPAKVDNFTEGTKAAGNQTSREGVKKEGDESEEKKSDGSGDQEDSLEVPRSHSLPNMAWTEDPGTCSQDSLFESEAVPKDGEEGEKAGGSWEYRMTRDYNAEIEQYFALKKLREQQKLKKKDLKAKQELEDAKMHERGPLVDENISLKICDLGNGCWTHHHFTQKIQTRQYRGPEVMLGIDYDTSSDLWSLACMVFELITGDFLFDPRKGQNYSKTDDHLA